MKICKICGEHEVRCHYYDVCHDCIVTGLKFVGGGSVSQFIAGHSAFSHVFSLNRTSSDYHMYVNIAESRSRSKHGKVFTSQWCS